ncbi:MAG: sigma 54-interacting transcriptional regulator [Byssovorax sp.]
MAGYGTLDRRMPKDAPSTSEHRGPVVPGASRKRAALVCAFPVPLAVALPDSGQVIGRAFLAERGLADTEVSGQHLKIDRAGGALRVADAGSRNGTWVNGARLSPRDLTPLDDGAVIRMGRTIFVYRRALEGSFDPAPPLEGLAGPFGLRAVSAAVAGLGRSHPRNVLIAGETGVGKELVARAVAGVLGRSTPFSAVNVAGVARSVFESQMFGHVAGAFSDAKSASPGVVAAHEGGALFLDEIGELDLDLQVKLLRLLENREVLPVGAPRPVRVDVLVIAATNRDLEAMVEEGLFRRDLHARLAMAEIDIPPLRHRREDIFAVAAELIRRAGGTLRADDVEVEAMERLLLAPWPSNVRGLDACLAAARRLDPAPGLRLWSIDEVLGGGGSPATALTEEIVEAAIQAEGGNVTAAAEKLGVTRAKLIRFRKRQKSQP